MKKLCILLCCCVCLYACGQDQNTYKPPPPPKVTVDTPVQQDVTEYEYSTGTTEASRSVDLQARVNGYLQTVNFQAGDVVDKGKLLFQIDPLPYQAELNKAKANLEAKKAELELARSTLQRKQSAYQDQAVSEVEVMEAKAKKDTAQAAIAAGKAQVEEAQINLDYTQIHAPFSGRISRNYVDPGNLINSSTLLASMVQYSPIYVYASIGEDILLKFMEHAREMDTSLAESEQDVPIFMALGNERAYPHQGWIDSIDTEVDTSTGTIQIRGVFPNEDMYIMPGLFSRLRFPIAKDQEALLVPDVALSEDQRGSFVYVVEDDHTVRVQVVTTGPKVDHLRVIRSGLDKDDVVIVNGIQRARPGAKVSPVQVSDNSTAQEGRE
ncbi:MAG: efflux RND transporter periplasmic adaptor subunit [Desulfovermiculus sp.]